MDIMLASALISSLVCGSTCGTAMSALRTTLTCSSYCLPSPRSCRLCKLWRKVRKSSAGYRCTECFRLERRQHDGAAVLLLLRKVFHCLASVMFGRRYFPNRF